MIKGKMLLKLIMMWAIGLIAGVVSVAWVVPRPVMQTPAQPAADLSVVNRDIAQLQTQLKQLMAALDQERKHKKPTFNIQWNTTVAKTSGGNEAAEDDEKTAASTPVSPPMADDQPRRKLITQLEDRFVAEARDERWAGTARSVITDYFDTAAAGGDGEGTRLDSVECKSSLCRVDVVLRDRSTADKFALNFLMTVASELPGISYDYHPMGDGRIGMTMYLSGASQ